MKEVNQGRVKGREGEGKNCVRLDGKRRSMVDVIVRELMVR